LRRGAVLVCAVAASIFMPEIALAQQRSFDVPSQPANRAIPQFAEQAGIQIIAPGKKLRNLRTRGVKGRLEVRQALKAMLEGTGLRIVADRNNTITLGFAAAPRTPPRPQAARATARRPERLPRVRTSMTRDEDAVLRAAAATQAGTREILVTGSRIKTNGYDSPVPLTVVDSRLIAQLGQSNAAEVVRLIPQNIATQSDATAGNAFSSDIGAAFANLRGLNPTFGTRTLLLVNGRRFVPTSDGGQVDLNLLPSIMIERVETVTGGASAAYGSDAVAGVVNVMLDKELDGFKGQIDYGQTGRGDGKGYHAAAAYGLGFAEGRGRLIVGGEYQRNRGISHCAEVRDWCAESWGIFVNAASIEPGTLNTPGNVSGYDVPGSAGYGLPNYIIGPGSGMIYVSPNGAIRNFTSPGGTSTTAFSNIFPSIQPPLDAVDKMFTPDGRAVVDYDPGRFGPKNVAGQAQGGDNPSAYSDQYVQTPLKRHTLYVAAEYELTDALKLSAELVHSRRRSSGASPIQATRSTMAIKPDNAFLPEAVAASLNGASFSLGKDVDNELDNFHRVDAKVFRGVLGLSGTLSSNWTWDAYYQYGKNRRNSVLRYSRHNDAFVMAIDAIRDPNDPSRIICRPLSPDVLATFTPQYRAELEAVHASCVPLNLFGIGNMSQEAIDFVWRRVVEDFEYRQHALAASVQGILFDGRSAGPVGVAAGIDYRDERGSVTHGGVNPNAFAGAFGLDYAGGIRVVEGFAETTVPLLRDRPFARFLELTGAIRHTSNRSTDLVTDRSRSVDATSWKIGGIYEMTEGVRFRTTRSRDIRAAGFRELFLKTAPTDASTIQGRVNNPNIPGPNKVDNTPIFTGGNFGLTPEKADTTTIGVVITPHFLRGLRASLDWYRIKITDAIANLNGQRVTDLCITYNLLCDRITFASPTDILRIDAGQANVGRIEIRGFDFEASYRMELAKLHGSMPGALDFRLLLNHQYDFLVKQNAAVPTVDYGGQSGPALEGGDFYPTPKWLWNALFAYDSGRFNATMTIRHVGRGILNADWVGPEDPGYAPTLPNSVNLNRVPARTYVNLALSYALPVGGAHDRDVELFGSIENLFDSKPPVAPGGTTTVFVSAYPTNPVFFDTFGTRWKAGMRVRF